MAKYSDAYDMRDEAAQTITRLGGTVLEVKPRQIGGDWFVHVETACPLRADVSKKIELNGVRIVVSDRGLPPRSARRKTFLQKLEAAKL